MSAVIGPFTKLGENLEGLTSDLDEVVSVVVTTPPQQPEAADFPLLIVEFGYEDEGHFQSPTMGGAYHVYPVSVMILVGLPSAGENIAELHDRALAFVKPLGTRLFDDIKLSATDNVLVLGWGGMVTGNEDVFTYRIGQIEWNQGMYFGLRARTWIKEEFVLAMN